MRQANINIEAIERVGPEEEKGNEGSCGVVLIVMSILLIVATFPLSMMVCLKVVQEYERAVIFRLGRLIGGGAKGPGLFFVIPCIDTYSVVDLRTISFDVPPQEVLTKDSVTISVDAVVYYRIWLPTIAIANVEDYSKSTRLLAAAILRNVLGTRNLSEVLSERETMSKLMREGIDEATKQWGVEVERVEIKDVRLPANLQRSMAAEAEASREAKAKIISAEGEKKASFALREAAEIVNGAPMALQLRYMQSVITSAAERESTIIFPIPINMMSPFLSKKLQSN